MRSLRSVCVPPHNNGAMEADHWRGGWGEYVGKDGCEAPHAYYGGSCDVLHTICGTQLTRRRTADVLPSLDGGRLLVRGEWQENNGMR